MKSLLAVLFVALSTAASAQVKHIEKDAKVFIEPMAGFETYLAAAFLKKNVPLNIVDDKAKADYIITGTSHTEKAGWAKTVFVSPLPQSDASISVKDAKSGILEYAYSVDKSNARRADQSTAEACAKHLKEFMDKQK